MSAHRLPGTLVRLDPATKAAASAKARQPGQPGNLTATVQRLLAAWVAGRCWCGCERTP